MKTTVFLILMFTSNLVAQQPSKILPTDTFPAPKICFKDWNKSIIPFDRFENGSELIATCENGVSCKVISYTLSGSDGVYLYEVKVNTNKFNDEALELFKKMPFDRNFYIEDIEVRYLNGVIKKAGGLVFRKVANEFDAFIKSALDDNPLIENFGVLKTNIRIKLEGTPDSIDYRIINELIDEIKPLLKTVSIKLVDNFPSFVLDFQPSVFNNDWSVKDTILNPLFPKANKKYIVLKRETTNFKFRKALITTAIVSNLAQFNFYDKDWEETAIFGWNHATQLTQYDKDLIKMLYSTKGQSELKKIKNIASVRLADNTLLVTILSLLLFIAFSEVNSRYHFMNLFGFAKYKFIRYWINAIVIVQIPIFVLIFLSILYSDFSFNLLINYEIYFCLLACLVMSFIAIIDIIISNIKTSGLILFVDFILITFSFIISYQIVYLFIEPAFLKIGVIEIQWLFIPIAIVAYRFYVNYSQKRMSSILREKELELAKQKGITLKSELLALQSRINPHFLYNALNSIASLVNIDAEKTEKMTLALARLFRYNINKGEETFSTIEQEIDIVKIYLDVEIVRFSDRLKYTIDVEKELINTTIPVFLLQPLVENAIKHGISKLTESGLIQIKIYSEDNWLVVSVYDNGPEFPSDIMINYGLQSIFDKLSLLYKNSYEVKFINSPDKHIRIKIRK